MALGALSPGAALAQTAEQPRVESLTPVPWPQAEPARPGPVTVEVEVEVDALGVVRGVTVTRGVSPRFDAAARERARSLRFRPAQRDGAAVAGRATIRIPFDAPLETTVTGRRPGEVGRRPLERDEVLRTPGTMGDPFRVIETLPGVMPIVTGLPYYFIRGAPPASTGTFVDGVRIPALFHLALGPSVLHPYLIDRVDFWPGGAPARYPGYVGGVVAASSREVPADRAHLDVDLRLVDAGALASVPLDEGRTRLSLSGRYSYTAAVLSAVSPGVSLDYWDYQARIERDVSSRLRASVFAFGSYDHLTSDNPATEFGQAFHRLVASLGWRLPAAAELQVSAIAGYETLTLDEGFEVPEQTVGGRASLRLPFGPAFELTLGGDVSYADSDLDQAQFAGGGPVDDTSLAFEDALEDPQVTEIGAFAEARIRLPRSTVVSPGVRAWALLARQSSWPALDPRLAVRTLVAPGLAIDTSAGLYHQRPSYLIPLPGLDSLDVRRGLQRSLQLSEGVQWSPGEGVWRLDAHVFLHRYDNLSDLDLESEEPLPPRLSGQAYGVELLLRRRLGERLSGWLAYTLSRNERFFDARRRPVACPTDVVTASPYRVVPGEIAPSEFDRTHILNVVGSYLLPGDVRAGARLQLRTGHPYTVKRCELSGEGVYVERNGARTQAYVQLDLRVDKTWRMQHWAFELYAELINVTFASDVVTVQQRQRRDGSFGPATADLAVPIVVPTLGVRGVF